MKIQQIRSATIIINFAGKRFLVDPWLAPKDSFPPIPGSMHPDLRSPIHELPLPIEEILNVDAIIATHLHFDHFDLEPNTDKLKTMPIFVQDEIDADSLKKKGFANLTILQEDGIVFEGVTIFKTNCYHATMGERERLYELVGMRGEACGIVFTHPLEKKSLYVAGDTTWYDGVSKAISKYNPDVIIVNSAAAQVAGFGKIIMGLDDIENVIKAAPKATIIASHMDNVGHATLFRKDIKNFAIANSLSDKLLIPEDGEIIEF